MSVVWFGMQPGETFNLLPGEPGDQGAAMLFHDGNPDWVRIPDETPHPDAGRRYRVRSFSRGPCPGCLPGSHAHAVAHLKLEGTDVRIAACAFRGWLLYTVTEDDR